MRAPFSTLREAATSAARRWWCCRSCRFPPTRSTIFCCRTRCWKRSRRASRTIVAGLARLMPLILFGAPLRHRGRLYNCAVAVHRGRLLGVVPKAHLPNYREFYERRHFASGDGDGRRTRSRLPGGRAVRPGPSLRGGGRSGLYRSRGDLRGFLGANSCFFGGCACGRNRARQSLRLQHHDRQGGDAPAPVAVAIGALPLRLSLRRGRGRGIDDRPRLGRAGGNLRERRAPRRDERFPTGAQIYVADMDLDLLRQERARMGTFDDNRRRHQARSDALPPRRPSASIRQPAISGCCAASSASPSCRTIPSASRSTATRPTTSRSPGSRSGWRRSASSAPSSASPAASIPPRR